MKNVTYISAGAGSGKTYKLTTKLAELVAKDKSDSDHVEPEQVILTTFTVKAANEFREKAKAELYKNGKYDEASRLDNALIGTIDSVASTLIQKYWYAIGMSPKQGVMDDSAKATYINQSIANIPTDEDLHFFAKFRKAFNITDGDAHPYDNFWKDHLKDIVEKSISFDITDYAKSVEESLDILKKLCNGTRIHIEHSQRIAVLEAMHVEVEGCKESGKKRTTLEAIDTLQNQSRYMDDIEWYSEFAKLLGGAPALPKNAVPIPILENAKQNAADLWCSQEVYDLQEKYIQTIFRLAKVWNEQYTQYKLNKRIVDFSDIEHYMYKLLQDKDVAKEIGRTYTHLFVDEFQDCSPIQVKIFMALADVVKQSFWVGDTKQAIYGFRGSDTLLTKAVADAISKKNGEDGCLTETLGESWRSVPALVDASNKAFVEIFRPIFGEETEKQVSLGSAMKNHSEHFKVKLEDRAKHPLRCLITERRSSRSPKLRVEEMAQYIKDVLDKEQVVPSDVAVLGRTGFDLDEVQLALSELGVACDRETTLNKGSKACQLMMALTTLTVNPQDDLAKAEIAYLTQDNMGVGAIIDSKLEYNDTPKEERKPWLGDTEMIKRVNALRPHVMVQGIGALMETLAVELDVKNIMERWDTPIEVSMTDVKALISAAKQYEDRSSELAQPATPSGFSAFLDENEVKLPFTGKGVRLLTMHGAKGLEWKYVFLLMDETLEPMSVLKRELYGIHHFHPEMPSAENLYPKMSIRLLPWIFGSRNSNVPESIANILFASEDYEKLYKHCIEESARLLYVGMTRAAEVLVLVPWFAKKEFDWFKRSGLTAAGNIDDGDVLGIGVPFEVIKMESTEEGTEKDMDEEGNMDSIPPTPMVYRCLDYHSDHPSEAQQRMVAPSGLKGRADAVNIVYRSEQLIKIASGKLHGRSYSEVGDCIHNVFAAIEHLEKEEVEQLIRSHGMDDVLPDASEVIRSWENLQGFLCKEYGKPLAEFHERPFRYLKENGTMVNGSIDYVYRTANGVVLIDFKTFPQVEAVTDPTSDHYAGWYAGQLDAYTDALEAAGEKVIKRFIYYPVSGLLCEIGRSVDIEGNDRSNQRCVEADDGERDDAVTLDEKNSLALNVSVKVFDELSSGGKQTVDVDVNQDSYESLLENIQGHLLLSCEEMPFYFYGCYFWNNGVFPYVVKKDLKYIMMVSQGRELVLRIKGHSETVKQRYTIEDNKYLEPDDNGDACEWTIHFEVEKSKTNSFVFRNSTGQKSKTYLLRWNPKISSFRLDNYREAVTQCPNGFGMNWSVYEWEEAHKGDRFFMLRTGDDNAGIVFRGVFTSEPYPGEDWAGKGKQRYYMDIDCFGAEPSDQKPSLDVDILEKTIPAIDWRRGHSGELLSDKDAEKLNDLWNDR